MILFQYAGPGISISHSVDTRPRPERFTMHTHTYAEVYCFLAGRGTFHIEGNEYPMEPGDILLMRPSEAHFIKMDPDIPYERIVLNFDTNLFSALDPDNELIRPFFSRKAGTLNLYRKCDFDPVRYDACLQGMLSASGGSRVVILANLILLLQQISRIFADHPMKAGSDSSVEQDIIQYINKNLHQELNLQILCDKFYISRAQLCRRFQKATGTSVGKYINVKRLLACRQLILEGEKPSKVYSAYGYRDYSTFYRAYTRQFGQSPGQKPLPLSETDRINLNGKPEP